MGYRYCYNCEHEFDSSEHWGNKCPPAEADGTSVTDNELATALSKGNHDALIVLFDRYKNLVFSIARRILKDHGEAEDTVQQVFLDVFRAIDQFDPQRASFKTWLMQYAYHRCFNQLEKLKSRRFYEWEELDYKSESWAGSPEDSCLLGEALASLNPAQRLVIELTYFEGLTAIEIARSTGETASNVRHHLYRGLRKLRNFLTIPETVECGS